jgi:hypothetical protein
LLLAFALVVGSFVPPRHVHPAGIEGRIRAVVHRHVQDRPAATRSGLSDAAHGDHERALFLDTPYERSGGPTTHAPAALEGVVTFTPPERLERWRAPDQARHIHGPPGALFLTRAPPPLA